MPQRAEGTWVRNWQWGAQSVGIHTDGHDGDIRYDDVIVSAQAIYIIAGIIALLLILNLACLCYANCGCFYGEFKNKRYKSYSKASQIATSDDDELLV